ncbi:hypothetical protein [Marilutibacter spongiae]|uniref:TnsA endonuclease N-terminal domain-containing protein n=1 Tax=Marilutibacter spongiae TaxID=2025720 RepID=A0A7W3TJ52_9GAMM|nr:hypothetical protein [Lysobacter spongiae]MBB1059272.1 hypothetical protein [Lysobacter spongiae]
MHDTKEATAPLPHNARVLTQAEEKRLDIYLYHSPKANGRLVTVVEPCRLAIALALEFDPDVTAFVERPRFIVADDQNVELCFWIRRSDNSEQYLLFRRQNKPTVQAVRKEERLCASVLAACKKSGISLSIRKAASIATDRVANATRLEMLPYVQAATTLHSIDVLVPAIMQHMQIYRTSSFYGLERSLPPFDWRDVRSATCALIHQGRLRIDPAQRLTTATAVHLMEKDNA